MGDHNGRYVLDANGFAVPEPDLMKWATWFENTDRHVALDETEFFRVSTIFLGLDHNYRKGPPLLFETMVFHKEPSSWRDLRMRRYATREQAEQGHAEMLAIVKNDPTSLL